MAKKPLELSFDGVSHRPVVVVAKVSGCEIMAGMKSKPLTERRMNKVARAIRAECEKRGIDRRTLGREIIRLGKKIRGK